MKCDVCEGTMKPDVLANTYRCSLCGFHKSSLPVRINDSERIDETVREIALASIRSSNFEQLLDETAEFLFPRATILDVGCAHGWFLNAAKARGYQAKGIEPDLNVAKRARAGGHEVLAGFFPDDLVGDERFDAVTFNDVFEHVPDTNGLAFAVRDRLNTGGLLIINLPVSDGFVFRLARLAARFGVVGPLERMWQLGLPSPHLSYFSISTLQRLINRAGFHLLKDGALQSISNVGLYQRIRYDRNIGVVKAAVLYIIARAINAAKSYTVSDVHYFIFKRD